MSGTTTTTSTAAASPSVECWFQHLAPESLKTLLISDVDASAVAAFVDISGSTSSQLPILSRGNKTLFGYSNDDDSATSILGVEKEIVLDLLTEESIFVSWDSRARLQTRDRFVQQQSFSGQTDPSCILPILDCESARAQGKSIDDIDLLVFLTDGNISKRKIAKFAAQQNRYVGISAVIVFLVLPRQKSGYTISPSQMPCSVFSSFTQDLLVVQVAYNDLELDQRVLHSSGIFASQIQAPLLTANTSWSDLPTITTDMIKSLTVTIKPSAPSGFVALSAAEYADVIISYDLLQQRIILLEKDRYTIDANEFDILQAAFPQLMTMARTRGRSHLHMLEKLMKKIQCQAVASISDTPELPELTKLRDLLSSIGEAVRQQRTEVATELRARLSQIQAEAEAARAAYIDPRADFLSSVSSFTQSCLSQISVAYSADYSAGSLYAGASNRAKKATTVDSYEMMSVQEAVVTFGCYHGECPIYMEEGPLVIAIKKLSTQLPEVGALFVGNDFLQTFPFSGGDVAANWFVPGSKPVHILCERHLESEPFTRYGAASDEFFAWLPALDLSTPGARKWFTHYLATQWTGGSVLSTTPMLLLASLHQLLASDASWIDVGFVEYLGKQLLHMPARLDMSDTGRCSTVGEAISYLLSADGRTPSAKNPFGALYRQPFPAVRTLIDVAQTFHINGQPTSFTSTLQTALFYETISKYTSFYHPSVSTDNRVLHRSILLAMYDALYDCSTGTPILRSGRLCTQDKATDIFYMINRGCSGKSDLIDDINIDTAHATILFYNLLTVTRHDSRKRLVSRFRRSITNGVSYFSLLLDSPTVVTYETLANSGGIDDIKTMLDSNLFAGDAVLDTDDWNWVPTIVSPFGPSPLIGAHPDGTLVPFLKPGIYDSVDEAAHKANTARRAFFRSLGTRDVAPCKGSLIFPGARTVCSYYGTQEGPAPTVPTRNDIVQILHLLYLDGRGAVMLPHVLCHIVLITGSYLHMRSSWMNPVFYDRTDYPVSYASKVEMSLLQLELVGEDDTVVVTQDALDRHLPSPRYTINNFIATYGEYVWQQLTQPLTRDEFALVFVAPSL